MIDMMRDAKGKRPAPISVYRALGYLLDNGLAHRLASQNAFIVCGHAHGAEEPVVFLICEQCGEVKEATSPGLAANSRRSLARRVSRRAAASWKSPDVASVARPADAARRGHL